MEMDRSLQLQYERNWDATIDHTLRRLVYGSLSGASSALLFFRSPTTRWAAVAFGAGVGVGSALTDSSQIFRAPAVSSPPTPAVAAVPDLSFSLISPGAKGDQAVVVTIDKVVYHGGKFTGEA